MLISQRLAEFIDDTNYSVLPPAVVNAAKERILDTVGAAMAGEASWELRDPFLEACSRLGSGECKVWGSGTDTYPLARAAMINSTFAHAAELDDGHKNAGCHAGAVVVPTALTLGKELHRSGEEILTAIVIGYEVVYRIVSRMAPYQIQKGFHPSGNCDTFGAMAVAGKLLGLNKEQLANGLGFAGLFASGLMEATISGQQSKCVQVGNAAMNGISAAYYAMAGMEGTTTVFEGKTGFFRAQAEPVDYDAVCGGLGKTWMIGDTYSKLYPTCRHSQPAIEGVLDLAEEYGFGYEAVESVWVGTHRVAYNLTGKIQKPGSASEAKFSLPYGVALALHEHGVGVGHLTPEYWNDPENIRLASLVTVVVDETVQSYYPQKRGAKIEVRLKDGRTFRKELYDLKGSPGNPIGWKELEEKFTTNLQGIFPRETIRELADRIHRFETLEEVGIVTSILYKK